MNEKEAIEVIKNIDVDYSRCKECVLDNETSCIKDGMDCQLIAINTVLQLLEQKDKRIDELEKALVEEAIKSTEKIEELNKGINTLMIKRKKWKNRYYKSKNIIYELLKILEE